MPAFENLSPEPINKLTSVSDNGRTPEEAIARSVIPWPYDDDKSRYLGLRASSFTRREAIAYMGIANSTVSWWISTYPEFAKIDKNIHEYRKILSEEYLGIEFIRNFRLVMEKDFRVLKKSLMSKADLEATEDSFTSQDAAYLNKVRSQYSPQTLDVIHNLLTGQKQGQGFDFTDIVKALAQSGEGRLAMEWKGAPPK